MMGRDGLALHEGLEIHVASRERPTGDIGQNTAIISGIPSAGEPLDPAKRAFSFGTRAWHAVCEGQRAPSGAVASNGPANGGRRRGVCLERKQPMKPCTTVCVVTAVVAAVLAGAVKVSAQTGSVDPWSVHLRRADEALARGDLSVAVRARHDAYGTALGARQRWEGMLAVGDLARRIGATAGTRQQGISQARQAYLVAFVRARQQGSLDGVLRTIEAFAELGDADVVLQGLHVAQALAAARPGDTAAADRVRELAFRLSDRRIAVPATGDRLP
jgi:hypothetical protein